MRQARAVHLDELKASRDNSPNPRHVCARILNAVLQVKQRMWLIARIVRIHQDSPALQEVAVPLKDQVDRRVEKRVTRTHEFSEWLSLDTDQLLFKCSPLVHAHHRLAGAN